jgi:hypothetical protein
LCATICSTSTSATGRAPCAAPTTPRCHAVYTFRCAANRVQLDVDKQLWDRTGLWYGAELMTPFGSASVVGIDAVNQLWVAHDVHVMTRAPVQLLSYGAFESVSALVLYGVHVVEDPALLGAAAAGATATPNGDKQAAAAADPLVRCADRGRCEFDASTAIGETDAERSRPLSQRRRPVNEVIADSVASRTRTCAEW